MAERRQAPPPVPTPRLAAHGGGLGRPADLAEALALLAEHPKGVVVAGSTDRGVDVNLRGVRAPLLVAVDRIPGLRELKQARSAATAQTAAQAQTAQTAPGRHWSAARGSRSCFACGGP